MILSLTVCKFLVRCQWCIVLDWFKSYLSDCSQCIYIFGSIVSYAKKLYSMVCLKALSLVLYSVHYSLLPSAKLFKIILAKVSNFMQIISTYVHLKHKTFGFAINR